MAYFVERGFLTIILAILSIVVLCVTLAPEVEWMKVSVSAISSITGSASLWKACLRGTDDDEKVDSDFCDEDIRKEHDIEGTTACVIICAVLMLFSIVSVGAQLRGVTIAISFLAAAFGGAAIFAFVHFKEHEVDDYIQDSFAAKAAKLADITVDVKYSYGFALCIVGAVLSLMASCTSCFLLKFRSRYETIS